jgi:hypothetical protein
MQADEGDARVHGGGREVRPRPREGTRRLNVRCVAEEPSIEQPAAKRRKRQSVERNRMAGLRASGLFYSSSFLGQFPTCGLRATAHPFDAAFRPTTPGVEQAAAGADHIVAASRALTGGQWSTRTRHTSSEAADLR